MAGIGNNYAKTFEEYKRFKDWADIQYVEFFNGHKEKIGDWVWDIEEDDFYQGISIMNTPTWVDTYFIQHCKEEFVINRMKEVYGSSYDELLKIDFKAITKGFKQNRKIKISKTKTSKFPIHSKPYSYRHYNNVEWWLQQDRNVDYDLGYNNETKTWANSHEYPTNTNTAHIKSLKGVIRHLRKQYLPTGITFTLSGRHIGEYYKILIK